MLIGLLGADGSGESRLALGDRSASTVVVLLLGVAIVAPIAEELAFRGYLFPALTRWRGPWIAALATAALFGLAHAFVYPPLLLPLMAIFGFALCLLRWFTRSLLPCVGLHAFNNTLAVSAAAGAAWILPSLLACTALAIAVLLPLSRRPAA